MNDPDKTFSENIFPAWLMRAKVHPTRQRTHILDRPSLIIKLSHFREAILSLIHAPAGYGKSTLLTAWRKQLLGEGIKVCWLSLDKEDNEIFQLLTYIAYSLSEGGVDFSHVEETDNYFSKEFSPRRFLSMINQIVETQSERIVLILDDFESLDLETVNEVIKPLLDYAPSNFHVAIASRDDRSLQVTNHETRGLVVRIHAKELCFTLCELQDFFANQVSQNTAEKIFRITEGWPVAIQMLNNSMNADLDVNHVLDNFNNNSNLFTNYLSEQIFQNLDDSLQSFLMDISLLDRVSCEFANYLRDDNDSIVRFESCKPLSTLILAVDQVVQTYRLHPLFREYLYDRLTTKRPSRAKQLHKRTASWFAADGDIVRSVKHSMLASEPLQATNTIQQAGGVSLWMREGLTRLRAVMRLLDDETIQQSPRLTSIKCLINIKNGKVHQAQLDHDLMCKKNERSEHNYSIEEQQQIDQDILLTGSMLSFYSGKGLSGKFFTQLIDNIGRIDPTEHPTLAHHFNFMLAAYVQRGLFKEARAYAVKAIDQFRQFRSVYGETYINFHLGDISFAEGKPDEAERYYQTGLSLTRQHFNDDKGMKLIVNVLIAELRYELNQTKKLPLGIETIPKQLEEREAWFDIYAAGYVTTSNIEYHRYGIEAALSMLDVATHYAENQKLESLSNLLLFQRITLLLRAGMGDRAMDVFSTSDIKLETYKNPEDYDIAWRECDAAVYAMVRLQLHEKAHAEALQTLDHFSQYAKDHGQVASYIRYKILQSCASHYLGKSEETYAHIQEALTLSRKSGFVRSFIDEESEIGAILNEYISCSLDNPNTEANRSHANEILGSFSAAANNLAGSKEVLSKREHEVLQQLSHGYSNKVIARNIDVSENTVRFHLKNMFTKLHASNRLQAVSAAQKRKLI